MKKFLRFLCFWKWGKSKPITLSSRADLDEILGRTLTLQLTNTTSTSQQVNLFSLIHPFNEKVKVSLLESSYDFLMKTCTAHPLYVSGAKVICDSLTQHINPWEIRKEEPTGRRISYKMFPLEHMSPLQFNSHLIDFPLFQMDIDGLQEICFGLDAKQTITMNLYVSKDKEKQNALSLDKLPFPMRVNEPFPDHRSFPIVIENDTKEEQMATLFDISELDGEKLNEKLSIKAPLSSYLELLTELRNTNGYKMGRLKLFTPDRVEQFQNPFFKEGEKNPLIQPTNYISPQNFIPNLVDITGFSLNVDGLTPLKVNIRPETRLICMFQGVSNPMNPVKA